MSLFTPQRGLYSSAPPSLEPLFLKLNGGGRAATWGNMERDQASWLTTQAARTTFSRAIKRRKKKSLCILCFVISGRHFPIAHLKWNQPTMALGRQLQHLLVRWDLKETHAEVFVYSQEQANKPTKPPHDNILQNERWLFRNSTHHFRSQNTKTCFIIGRWKNENYLDGELAPAALFIGRKCALPRAWSDLVAKGYIWLWRGFRVFDVKAWKNFTSSSSPVSGPMKMHLEETPACQPPTPCVLNGFGKGLCENGGREGAERGFVSWLSRTLGFNPPFLFFIFFFQSSKMDFFFLDGKWLRWLPPLIFIELKFHWPPFLDEAYFIPWWSAGLDVRPS